MEATWEKDGNGSNSKKLKKTSFIKILAIQRKFEVTKNNNTERKDARENH